jgi:hypothetical protein
VELEFAYDFAIGFAKQAVWHMFDNGFFVPTIVTKYYKNWKSMMDFWGQSHTCHKIVIWWARMAESLQKWGSTMKITVRS